MMSGGRMEIYERIRSHREEIRRNWEAADVRVDAAELVRELRDEEAALGLALRCVDASFVVAWLVPSQGVGGSGTRRGSRTYRAGTTSSLRPFSTPRPSPPYVAWRDMACSRSRRGEAAGH